MTEFDGSTTSGRPLTGRAVLIMTVTFFAVIIGVNVLMMTLAIRTLPGTDVDSAYRASLAYGSEIAAAHEQDARKWHVEASVARLPDGEASLKVEARDASGAPLAGIAFSGRLERPTDKREDRAVSLDEVGAGSYRGHAAGVAPGLWDLVVEGDRGGQRVFLSKNRIVLN